MQNTSNNDNDNSFQILGIPLKSPTRHDYLTALTVAAIVGLPCFALVYFDTITLRNAVLTVTGAIVGIMMNSIGIDPKVHGARAWGALLIIAAMTFMATQIAMQYIPGLRPATTEVAKPADTTVKKENTVKTEAKTETSKTDTAAKSSAVPDENIKVLPEVVVRPTDTPVEQDPRAKSLEKDRTTQD